MQSTKPKSPWGWIPRAVLYGVLIYGVILLIVAFNWESVCLPGWAHRTTCPNIRPQQNDYFVLTKDKETLHGRLLDTTNSAFFDHVILYCHGNAGNVPMWEHAAKPLLEYGNVLIFDYRGYGRSSGKPSEAGFQSDVEAWYDFVKQRFPKISIYGRSVGAPIAAYAASKFKCERLILETPLHNLRSTINHHTFHLILTWLVVSDDFDLKQWLDKVTCPVYMIFAQNDRIVPYKLTSHLAKRAQKSVVVKATHNDCWLNPRYDTFMAEIFET